LDGHYFSAESRLGLCGNSKRVDIVIDWCGVYLKRFITVFCRHGAAESFEGDFAKKEIKIKAKP
jgi:hypothetical protein